MKAQVASYDLDPYLHPDTLIICENLLRHTNYSLTFDFSGQDDTHKKAYTYLRTALYMYKQSNGPLAELPSPTGAHTWIYQYQQEISHQQEQPSLSFLIPLTDDETSNVEEKDDKDIDLESSGKDQLDSDHLQEECGNDGLLLNI